MLNWIVWYRTVYMYKMDMVLTTNNAWYAIKLNQTKPNKTDLREGKLWIQTSYRPREGWAPLGYSCLSSAWWVTPHTQDQDVRPVRISVLVFREYSGSITFRAQLLIYWKRFTRIACFEWSYYHQRISYYALRCSLLRAGGWLEISEGKLCNQ